MNSVSKPTWQHWLVLTFFGLIACTCDNGTPTPTPTEEPASTDQECHGDLYVEMDVVARVTPEPRTTYQEAQTYTWDAPYGIEVTDSGEAILQVFDIMNNLLSKFNIYAADAANGQITIEEWNGLKTITFDAGNFYVQDDGGQDFCELDLLAQGVGISSVSTEYVITVRPEINEVTIAVLDGVVSVTSRGVTVTLDARVPDAQLVVVSNGEIGELLPIPDPGRLLDDVITGRDIVPEIREIPGSLSMWADDKLLPILEALGEQFERDTGISVLIEGMPLSEIPEIFVSAAVAGEAPDLITLQHNQIYGLVDSELLLPMESMSSPNIFVPGTVQAFNVNGVNYGVPYEFYNLALVSNPAYVTGIPSTWSELSEFAIELSSGREFFSGLMIPADGYHFYPVQSAFGGYIFGSYLDGSYNSQDIGLDNDGSLAAARWLEDLVNTQDYFMGDEEEALQRFQDGSVAIILTGPWSLPRLRQTDTDFLVHSFPREIRASEPFLSVNGFVISRQTRLPDYAQEFITNYLTSRGAMESYAFVFDVPPARRDVLDNLDDPDVRAFGLSGVLGVPIPNIPEMQLVWDPWTNAVQGIMAGELSAEEAFIDASDQIRESLDQ